MRRQVRIIVSKLIGRVEVERLIGLEFVESRESTIGQLGLFQIIERPGDGFEVLCFARSPVDGQSTFR